MAIEIVQHGIDWINDEKEKLKCPECGKKDKTMEVDVNGDTYTVTFICQRCKCIYKLERTET